MSSQLVERLQQFVGHLQQLVEHLLEVVDHLHQLMGHLQHHLHQLMGHLQHYLQGHLQCKLNQCNHNQLNQCQPNQLNQLNQCKLLILYKWINRLNRLNRSLSYAIGWWVIRTINHQLGRLRRPMLVTRAGTGCIHGSSCTSIQIVWNLGNTLHPLVTFPWINGAPDPTIGRTNCKRCAPVFGTSS